MEDITEQTSSIMTTKKKNESKDPIVRDNGEAL